MSKTKKVKQTWKSPTYKKLPVSETMTNPGTGPDGGPFVDDTAS